MRSALRPEDYPKAGLPEVAFAGRSNVGKSSLLNCLWGLKGFARTSSTPGRTRTINFYLVEERYYFVDLPGYGYARVPLAMRLKWKEAIESYFNSARDLRGVVVIMDSRLGPTELDRQMFLWLEELGFAAIPVLTKADKATQRELSQAQSKVEALCKDPPLVFSAKTGQGKDRLWKRLLDLLKGEATPLKDAEIAFAKTTDV